MIEKLQRRFIAITTLAITAVMLVLLAVLNLYNYGATYNEAYATLRFIADNKGEIGNPDAHVSIDLSNDDDDFSNRDQSGSSGSSESALKKIFGKSSTLDLTGENSYLIRYYSVIFDSDRNVTSVNIKHIASINEEQAIEKATELLSRTLHRGHFIDNKGHTFTYLNKRLENKSRIIVVMDTTSDLADAASVIRRSFLLGVLCLIVFVVIVVFLSKKAMMPLIRNIENQKSFITNAGHELKTPLAVIKADTEVLEMTTGANEWTKGINDQVDRLTVLVGNLITLAKMGELDKEDLTIVDFSSCVKTAADNYKTVISNQGKTLETNIKDKVKVKGTKDGLTEMVNILIDNAQKYCDEKGVIKVELTSTRMNSGAKLTVSNDYAAGKDVDYTRFFERFYRGDESHNAKNKTSGYGIGLSMAEGFAEAAGGKIAADWSDGRISFIVLF
ncbi:MAG: HAMP domain-containing histidine kinase [Lachnospiraceae bacterium]|nr:HAMP domain-containing histidine kinase [Lachnospiraceae bacterium]